LRKLVLAIPRQWYFKISGILLYRLRFFLFILPPLPDNIGNDMCHHLNGISLPSDARKLA
jgi:hypothetical protein